MNEPTDAGLRYASDVEPGIRRRRRGKTFTYVDGRGKPVRDRHVLERIRKLAIPPAWEDVWIAADASAHLQATGRDARGRKQYRYHDRWREVRDAAKFDHLARFARRLPRIRRRVRRDLGRRGLPREKVLAAVVSLLDATLLRVGNERYRRANKSFGLTTLRDRHASVRGGRIHLAFRAKSGKEASLDLADPRLARVVKRCQDLPGQHLFNYVGEDGAVHGVDSSMVNAYLREIAGEAVTAKDFRTWGATVLAAEALGQAGDFTSKADSRRRIKAAVTEVAEHLGNTPAICRKSYIHPTVVDCYLSRTLLGPRRERSAQAPAVAGLRAAERRTLALLEAGPAVLPAEDSS
ncbi:MAG: DNA topoisomerase I [Rhodospirillaceae bacterium]|nr:DNA topoisomerase I [Rhodospirillaceae bacterium]